MKLYATLGALAIAGLSQAAIFTYTFASDVTSVGEEGEAGNSVASINLGVGSVITGIGWETTHTATSPSWLSEQVVSFAGAGAPELYLTPGDDDNAGTASYSSGGIVDITGIIPGGMNVSPTGAINMEFFESFDDSSVTPDGFWHAGSTLTFEYTPVPEPATMAALGLGAAALLRRRRK